MADDPVDLDTLLYRITPDRILQRPNSSFLETLLHFIRRRHFTGFLSAFVLIAVPSGIWFGYLAKWTALNLTLGPVVAIAMTTLCSLISLVITALMDPGVKAGERERRNIQDSKFLM